ncbi:MAG TPA: DUF4783 domain-containing protein [Chitinophagaceae bacterium]
MQKFLTLTTAVLLLTLSAFTPLKGLDDVINALRTGNATEMSKYIDDNVEISLPDKTGSYSRAQSIVILQEFFNNNGVKGFDVKHKGDNGANQFVIGTLQTKAGSYRTTVFMKSKNGRQLVKEIRFQST